MVLATKINHWTNRNVVFVTDEQSWGLVDYWQTPRETLRLRTGDCEDYAVLKWNLLQRAGVHPDQVQVWYGISGPRAHMVVTWCGWVLDNLTDEVLTLSQSAFQPKFRVDNTNLTRWTNLQQRIK